MKLEIVSQTGRPADPVKAKAYEAEWQSLYDRSEAKAAAIFKKPPNRLSKYDHMQILERHLRFCEHYLVRKYSKLESVEVPKNARQWAKLLERYDGPVMVAKRTNGKLVLMKMDGLQF